MNKMYLICLNCGNVQVRTDINEQLNGKYTLIRSKIICPKCCELTKQVETKNISVLKKKLSRNPRTEMDNYISSLIS